MRGQFLATSPLSSLQSSPLGHTLTLASSRFSLGDGGGKPYLLRWVYCLLVWGGQTPRDFLRQQPVDGGLRVILGASLQCQGPVAWLSPPQTEAEVLYLPQSELADCNSVGPATHPLVKVSPLQESLVEAPLSVIHLSWRC